MGLPKKGNFLFLVEVPQQTDDECKNANYYQDRAKARPAQMCPVNSRHCHSRDKEDYSNNPQNNCVQVPATFRWH